MSLVIKKDVAFEIIECYKCRIPFAVTVDTKARWKDDGSIFYCPNGHDQHYAKSTVQHLQEQLDQKERELSTARQSTKYHVEREEEMTRKYRAQKAAKTRIMNRVAHGVCPCCNRTFKNLEAHMSHKHPDYGQGKKKGEQP